MRSPLAAGVAVLCFSLAGLVAGQSTCEVAPGGPQLWGFDVVARYPHDSNAFTQGLLHGVTCDTQGACSDVFWESTGLYGSSTVRRTALQTGAVQAKTALSRSYFGEGLARLGDKLYQLTYKGNLGFVYNLSDLKQVGTFRTPLRDGWGMATVGSSFVLSDGSSTLTWVDPAQGFKAVKAVTVRDGARTIGNLNELEYIEGEVWANIWQTDCIARICPDSGKVKGWLLLHGLSKLAAGGEVSDEAMDVLNGIAYDAARKRLFVTGKKWPRVFEITLRALDASNAQYQQQLRTCYVKS